MDPFIRQSGTHDTAQKKYVIQTKWLSYFNGFMYLGQATGTIVGSMISRRYGRRMCMFTMSIWAIVCATLAITFKSPSQIMVARVLNYIYIGMELAVVPIFQSEITPKKSRGFVVATYQISLYSPRWLIMSDRYEDAHKALHQLREGKFTEEEIQGELDMIADGIRNEPEQSSFREIFKGANLRRTWIVVGANVCMQATGNQFTSIYGAVFAKSLGTVNPFNVTIAIAVTNVCTAFLAMVLLDRVGRRIMILIGPTIQVSALMTMGGLGTAAQQTFAIKSGVVAMMVIFNHGYSLGWAPVMHILGAEIPNTRCRDMTYRCASVLNIATQFAVTFSIPYFLNEPYANLKSKVGFIFGSTTAVSIIFAYFCVPNCHGRSFEEVNWLFENQTPTRKFGKTKIDLQEEATIRVQAKSEDAEQVEAGENSKQT